MDNFYFKVFSILKLDDLFRNGQGSCGKSISLRPAHQHPLKASQILIEMTSLDTLVILQSGGSIDFFTGEKETSVVLQNTRKAIENIIEVGIALLVEEKA